MDHTQPQNFTPLKYSQFTTKKKQICLNYFLCSNNIQTKIVFLDVIKKW